MSYVKLLVGYNTVVPNTWVNNIDTAFNNLDNASKAAFVLEQSVFVNYIRKVYNNLPPILLKSYAKTIEGYFDSVNQIYNNSPEESADFKQCVSFADQLLHGQMPKNYEEIISLLKKVAGITTIPHIVDANAESFYRPFFMYYGSEGSNVSYTGAATIPTFALRGRFVFVNFATKTIGYKFNESVKSTLEKGPYPIAKDCIFGYLSGYNWSDLNFSQLLGILGSYCFDLDNTNVPSGSYEMIYKLCRSVVTAYTSSVSPYVDSLVISDDTALRRLFISFLIDLRKIHGLKLDDAQTLAKLMGNDKQDDIENLNAYLEATKASDISTEMLNAFKQSIFSDFEELFIENRSFKKKDKINDTCSSNSCASILMSAKENLKALYNKEARITDTAAFADSFNVDESGTWSVEAEGLPRLPKMDIDDEEGELKVASLPRQPKMDEADDDVASDDVGATGDDDTLGTESDTDKDPSTMESDQNDPDLGTDKKKDKTYNAHVPDLPNVSDKKGVKLELSSSESTDTVFYRLELKTFINSVLANPPKSLSVQKIEMLKKIKAFWINTLAPQCVYDVVSTIIHLPSMFTIHTKNKGK